jgi:protein-tyrosine phosphatase
MKAEIYWIEGPWTGRLAVMPRPRSGDWLKEEIREWRSAGIDIVVSTLTSEEIAELDLAQEAALCKTGGMEYIVFPIADRGVPLSARAAADLLRHLEGKLAEGKNVAIHCRQGIGRSPLLAACLLISAGAEPEAAFRRVGEARGCSVPETAEQREWVTKLSHHSLALFREG